MTTALTAETLRRRFVILSGLLWLPSGLVMPVLVLLARSRGLDVATIGMLFAVFGGLVIALEIPSGSFADVFGRRRTLMLSGLVRVIGMAAFAVAQEPAHFMGALALHAVARSLQSGPLEAWYVDSVHAVDPSAPVRQGIARGWAAEAVALALGAVVGGFVPRWFSGLEVDGLLNSFSIPFLISGALTLLALIAFAALMVEAPHVEPVSLRDNLRAVPRTLGEGVRLATHDSYLRLLLLAMMAMGFAVSALEVMAPVQFATLLGGEERASAAYGILVTAAFLGTAGGSVSAPRVATALSGSASRAAAWSTAAIAVALLGLALGTTFAIAAAAYVLVYLLAGIPGPLKNDIAHTRVGSGQRATLLSVNSLTQQIGGVFGSLSVPALAGAFGFRYGWLATAVVVLVGAGMLLLLPKHIPAADGVRLAAAEPD